MTARTSGFGPDTTTARPSPDVTCPACGHVGPVDPLHGAMHRALDNGERLLGSVWRTRSTGKLSRVTGFEPDGAIVFVSMSGVAFTVAGPVLPHLELVELGPVTV